VEFPELAARTHGFTRGAPHQVTVAADGSRVLFLRSAGPEDPTDALWTLDLPGGGGSATVEVSEGGALSAVERQVVAGPIDAYAADPLARVAALVHDGRLRRVDLRTGAVTEIVAHASVRDARPDPTGARTVFHPMCGSTSALSRSTVPGHCPQPTVRSPHSTPRSNSTCMPAASRLRVVSPPALTSSRKNHWNSASVKRSPPISSTRSVTRGCAAAPKR